MDGIAGRKDNCLLTNSKLAKKHEFVMRNMKKDNEYKKENEFAEYMEQKSKYHGTGHMTLSRNCRDNKKFGEESLIRISFLSKLLMDFKLKSSNI